MTTNEVSTESNLLSFVQTNHLTDQTLTASAQGYLSHLYKSKERYKKLKLFPHKR
jgi:hypothetical protein